MSVTHRAVGAGPLADWHEQLRVVERRRRVGDARVRERLQERDEVVLLRLGQAEVAEHAALLVVGEVAVAVVEVDDLAQRHLAAVVEVRRGQRDVAQLGHLERAAHLVVRRAGPARLRQRVAERVEAAEARVARGRPDADVEEPGVDRPAAVGRCQADRRDVRRGRVRQAGAEVAGRAPARAAEDVEAGLGRGAERGGVAREEPVGGRLVGDERRLVGLDREPPEEREVELHEREPAAVRRGPGSRSSPTSRA